MIKPICVTWNAHMGLRGMQDHDAAEGHLIGFCTAGEFGAAAGVVVKSDGSIVQVALNQLRVKDVNKFVGEE